MSKKNGRTKKRPKKRQEKNANFWKTKKKNAQIENAKKKTPISWKWEKNA